MAIVYRHRRLDTNEIFYVGIGNIKRATFKFGRNNFWNKIITKTNYSIEIIQENLSWEDACELEIFLISLYGRRDLGTGTLTNLTCGGEGSIGTIVSKDTRDLMSKKRLGKRHTKESINIMKKCRLGDKHIKSKLVLDLQTGIFFYCAREAAEAYNINYTTLKYYLRGKLTNKTTLIYC